MAKTLFLVTEATREQLAEFLELHAKKTGENDTSVQVRVLARSHSHPYRHGEDQVPEIVPF